MSDDRRGSRKSSRQLRASAALVGAVAGALLLSACGSDDVESSGSKSSGDAAFDKVISAAEKEGKVVIYSSRNPEVLNKIRDAFNKDFPKIKLEYFRDVGGVLEERVKGERASGSVEADVAQWSNPFWMKSEAAAGRIAKLTGPIVSAAPDACFVDSDVAISSSNPLVIGYNTKAIKDPTSIDDFASPKLKALMAEPVSAPVVSFYDAYGRDWLKAVSEAGNWTLGTASPVMMQSVASGESDWAVLIPVDVVKGLADSGAPVAEFVPENTPVIDFATAALADAPHPNAAQVFIDWTMTSDAQELLTSGGYGASCLPEVTDDIELTNAKRLTAEDVDPAYVAEGQAYFKSLF